MTVSPEEENLEPHEHVTAESLDFDAISKVANRVQIKEVRLQWLHAELNVEVDFGDDWQEKAFIFWDTHLYQRHSDGDFSAIARLIVRMKEGHDPSVDEEPPDYDPEDQPQVELAAEYALRYSLRDFDQVTDNELEHFCHLNATANAWGYWRELMQSTTSRMCIPPLVLPVLPVPRLDT